MAAMCGGISQDIKPADDCVAGVLVAVKEDFGKKSSQSTDTFKAVHYKTQIVAGTNYFVKVDLGNGNYAHLRIYEPLPHTNQPPQLHSFQTSKKLDDPIEYF